MQFYKSQEEWSRSLKRLAHPYGCPLNGLLSAFSVTGSARKDLATIWIAQITAKNESCHSFGSHPQLVSLEKMVSLGRSHNGCQTPTDIAPVCCCGVQGPPIPIWLAIQKEALGSKRKTVIPPNQDVRAFFRPGHALVKIYFFSYIIHIIMKYKFFLKLVPQPRISICVMTQGPECDSAYDTRDHVESYCSISLTQTSNRWST
jgi:hypothetical protein